MDRDRIKRDFDRIKKHREEKAQIGTSEREIFTKLKSDGFNPKALRFLLTLDKMKDRKQFDDDTDVYRVALGMAADAVRAGEMSLREAGREFGVSKSAIHREISVPQVSQRKAITPCWSLANEIAERERIAAEAAKAERERKKREKDAKIAELMAPVPMPDCPPFLRRQVAA